MDSDSREGIIAGLSATAVGLIAVALIIGIVVVGWAVGGWFEVQNAKRQGTVNNIVSHNYVHNYGYQLAQREAVSRDVLEINQIGAQMANQPSAELQALGNQRGNTLITLCSDASKVDPSQGPLPDAAFVQANCSGSVPNPASPYVTHPTEANPK